MTDNGFKKQSKEDDENLISKVPREMDKVLPIASKNFDIATKRRGR